jgi:hypothetical protein
MVAGECIEVKWLSLLPRAQRSYPDAKTSEYPVRGNPVGEWSGNSHEDYIH